MFTLMAIIFVIGYAAIALESYIKVNKTATAMFLGVLLWVILIFDAEQILTLDIGGRFNDFLKLHPELLSLPQWEQYVKYIAENQVLGYLGEISEILFFLMGAMTIVEIIDQHGGFNIITDRIKTRSKLRLIWLLPIITFFLSAVLDNLTTAIVMVALLRKLIDKRQDRWLFAGVIIIASNAGGAWSPIGDVTTIMLWLNGNVTAVGIIKHLFLPSLISLVVPLIILSFFLKGQFSTLKHEVENHQANGTTRMERNIIFILGIGALVFTPVFKILTHLPPFLGMLLGLSVIWIFTELMYYRKHDLDETEKKTVTRVIKNVDFSTILFFLGILFAIDALQTAGHLSIVSNWLDKEFSSVYLSNIFIGLVSAIVDNVPLVASVMGMHPVEASIIIGVNNYSADSIFWNLLAYCAGTGGSILIIGSAAGVAVMGLEKIEFIWYLKRISVLALIGYLAGVLTYFFMF